MFAYALGGFFAAMGGLAATATTGIGTPYAGTFITLNSVAAIVLGGVSLAGGKGGLVGPVAAAFCLTLVPSIMVFQGIDPNYGQVIQGALIVIVVMLGGLLLLREQALSTATAIPDEELEPRPGPVRAAGHYLIDRPLIMLSVILVLLLIACEIASPGYLSARRMGTILQFSAPLAFLAAGQTLVMLTAGIDLSVAATATAAAYIMAGQASRGTATALAIAVLVGLVVGLVNGVGVGIFRVNPLIMTLGMASIVSGYLTVSAQSFVTGVPLVPEFVRELAVGNLIGEAIPKSLLLWAPVAALILFGLRYSGYGRMLYAVGDNPLACRLAGVRIWQVLLIVYVLCSVLAAIGGVLYVGVINAADLQLVSPYLLPSVAAVVIGGTSIFGGIGGYSGTILGAIILVVLDSLLTLLDASQAFKQILYGTIILLLAWLYATSTKRV